MSQKFVLSFEHLRDKPRAGRALEILQRVTSLVKPIMRKHAWRLPVLAEFFPDQSNLLGLNINMGRKILLRLRPPFSPDTFLEEESIVQTMLHELTHNVHGPHDDAFYKFLSEIQNEYDVLKQSGYAGEGFYSPGSRLGAGSSHNVPLRLARRKALEAAEKRIHNKKLPSPGGRLGGRLEETKALSLRELAARAAERRARDEKSCASSIKDSEGTSLAEREVVKAQRESTLTQAKDLPDNGIDYIIIDDEVIAIPADIPGSSSRRAGHNEWSCPSCTLWNNVSSMICELCEMKRPAQTSAQPSRPATSLPTPTKSSPYPRPPPSKHHVLKKPQASHKGKKPQFTNQWACRVCTLLNDSASLQCVACTILRPLDE